MHEETLSCLHLVSHRSPGRSTHCTHHSVDTILKKKKNNAAGQQGGPVGNAVASQLPGSILSLGSCLSHVLQRRGKMPVDRLAMVKCQ